MQFFIDLLLHTDQHLAYLVDTMGVWTYVILFLIIFAETGLVVFPLLPGDSLLFATGAIISLEQKVLDLPTTCVLLIIAGILGDALNYSIGKRVGPKVFRSETSRWLNRQHLIETQNFFEKYGTRTIILARFAPIVRTFAPFVAGMGKMSYRTFATYNVVGAILWVSSFVVGGYYFGQHPFVKRNFQLVILAIIVISFMPVVLTFLRRKKMMFTA